MEVVQLKGLVDANLWKYAFRVPHRLWLAND
jgi:hypothetical protein